MIEDFSNLVQMFPQAVVAGLVIATVCSLLGVFVILKRVVFIGITLAQVAACGVAAGMVFGFHSFLGATVLTLATVALLSCPFEAKRIPRDSVLGVIFVFASALSILLVAKSGFGLHKVKNLLYGDLILTGNQDLVIILAVLVPVLVYVLGFLRPTVHTFVDREAAKVLGLRVTLWELLFFFALGLAVSAASRVAGALLVFCFLVVTPSLGLLLSRRLAVVMTLSVAGGVLSTVAGLYLSFTRDLPTNHSVAITACGLFLLAVCWRLVRSVITALRYRFGHTRRSSSGQT